MRFTPHKYQKTAIDFLLAHREAGLFIDPGLGKTSIALTAFAALLKCPALRKNVAFGPALVVAPLRVTQNVWTQNEGGEISKWDEFKDLQVVLLHGSHKDAALDERAHLYVINYDGLPWLLSRTRTSTGAWMPAPIERLFTKGLKTLILDELSKVKTYNTKRFKLLKPFLPRFTRRWGLTGSPAANGLLDLFGECYCLDLGKALGQYITHFRMQYFTPGGFKGYDWQPMPGAHERIYRQLEGLALSMRAVDHLKGLPELVEDNLWCDIPDKSRKLYDDLEDDLIGELNGETITALTAAVVSGKLRQIASGGIYVHKPGTAHSTSDGTISVASGVRDSRLVHHAKTEALADLIYELQGQPLLVGYEFQHDLERIREKLGNGLPVINGDTKPAQCAEILKRWNEGKIPVLVGHPQSMGHGLNMQYGICAHVCFYTTPWDYDSYSQFIARVWRQGNKAESVIVSRLIARKTIDEVVARTVGNKAREQVNLMEALKAFAKGRKSHV